MITLFFALSMLGPNEVPASTETRVVWNSDYSAAVRESQNVDKPLLVVIQGRNQGTAKHSPILSKPIEQLIRTQYVAFYASATTPGGRRIAQQFGVSDQTYVSIIDRSGTWQVFRFFGQPSNQMLQARLKQHSRAIYVKPTSMVAEQTTTSSSPSTLNTYPSQYRSNVFSQPVTSGSYYQPFGANAGLPCYS